MHHTMLNGQNLSRRLLRAALLAGPVLVSHPAFAGPSEDAAARAAEIQKLLDVGKPADAEAIARAALAAVEAALGAESVEAANLRRLAGDTLFDQKRYGDAEPFFRSALALREKLLGPDHLDTARSNGDLAANLKASGDYAGAEPYYRRALAIRERALGRDHADVIRSLWRLALVIDLQKRLPEAVAMMREVVERGGTAFGLQDPLLASALVDLAAMQADDGGAEEAILAYRRALAIRETAYAAGDSRTTDARLRLAKLLSRTGRVDDMTALFEAALTREETALGKDHPKVGDLLDQYATQLMLAGRPDRAEPLFARVQAIRLSTEGAGSIRLAEASEDHAVALKALERLAEAEKLYRDALAIRETVNGVGSAEAVTSTIHLANIVEDLDRPVEAETLYKRALESGIARLGQDNILVGFTDLFLGMLFFGQNRIDESEPLLRRGVAVMEANGQAGGLADTARSTLGLIMVARNQTAEAVKLYEGLVASSEKSQGAQSTITAKYRLSYASMLQRLGRYDEAVQQLDVATPVLAASPADAKSFTDALNTMGDIRRGQKRYAEAGELFRDVIARRTNLFGATNRTTLSAMADLALVEAATGDDDKAAELLERYTAVVDAMADANAAAAAEARVGRIEDSAVSSGAVYDYLAKIYARLADEHPERRGEYSAKAFAISQRVIESQAAAALQQMASRQAAGSGELARLLRDREDLLAAWQKDDRRLTGLRASSVVADDPRVTELQQHLSSADERIRAIDADIRGQFPGYAALQRPALPDFAAVQAALGENDVLLFYADTNRMNDVDWETYLWAIPKSGEPRWVKLERSTGEISGAVRTMRGLLGVGGETRGAQKLGAGVQADRTGDVLKAGEEIYKALLGPVDDLIAGRNLVIVPSKRLANLPFQLLVSRAPSAASQDRYRDARWLVADHALTVLPSVASLTALDAVRPSNAARDAYLAFANPLLTGRSGDDRRAYERKGCAPARTAAVEVAALEAPEISTLFRGAGADVAAVRALQPLPETTDEVCAVASALGVGPDALHLGADANEDELKALSEDGGLADARILHFATHGLVSGELSGLAEPAIVLSPPETPTQTNDGLLTASEVTTLKIDADWVILSACNTASGEGGGEALSGLARAFFYAGARALMVSHWPVNSDAAVSLVTTAVGEITRDPSVNRAEALRRAMVAEIAKGGRHADPANWAPFILVGASR